MPRRGLWIDATSVARHLSDNDEKRTQIYRTIDRNGFDWQVFLVAASGFFTDSYNLFATNIILPCLAYVYWPNDTNKTTGETYINIATLVGSVIGQLLFGYLADRYGRRKLYGLELIIVIVSTLGITQASQGFKSMNILAWLIFYRLMQGVGIGGEYPMSALITAEFAPVGARARMMASVFLMQPLGTLAAALVGLAVVYGYSNANPGDFGPDMAAGSSNETKVIVDTIWRWVIGVGAFPAFLAILFRLTIPESPRYTLDVDMDAHRALQDALQHYGSENASRASGFTQATRQSIEAAPEVASQRDDVESHSAGQRSFELDDISPMGSDAGSVYNGRPAPRPTPQRPSFSTGLRQHLMQDGNWRWLAAASICWFILDFAYYGLGINNPRTLAKVWASEYQNITSANNTSWDTDAVYGNSPLSGDDHNIFYVLRNDALRSIITTSVGALVGSAALIQLIPYIHRRTMLVWTFAILFVLLLVAGTSLFGVFQTDSHSVTIVLYVLIQLFFNLGPNTLLFILPAELFPTRYRGTCYGIASASGKVSAIIVQAVLPNIDWGAGRSFRNVNDKWALGGVLIIWAALMLCGAAVAATWLPDVQKARSEGFEDGYKIPSKTLEELAEGRGGVAQGGRREVLSGIRRRFWEKSDGRNGNASVRETSPA